jgi:hypothetical protein
MRNIVRPDFEELNYTTRAIIEDCKMLQHLHFFFLTIRQMPYTLPVNTILCFNKLKQICFCRGFDKFFCFNIEIQQVIWSYSPICLIRLLPLEGLVRMRG